MNTNVVGLHTDMEQFGVCMMVRRKLVHHIQYADIVRGDFSSVVGMYGKMKGDE